MTKKAPYELDPTSAKTIIEWESDGHNGCAVCFGDDGMMYVTSGDGTSDSDTNLTGQRTDLLLAKVLRIDVDKPGRRQGVQRAEGQPVRGRQGLRAGDVGVWAAQPVAHLLTTRRRSNCGSGRTGKTCGSRRIW